MTFAVVFNAVLCGSGPLNTSQIKHPNPHISVDLKRCIVLLLLLLLLLLVIIYHFSFLLDIPGLFVSGGSYLRRLSRDLIGILVSENGCMYSTPPNFHSPIYINM